MRKKREKGKGSGIRFCSLELTGDDGGRGSGDELDSWQPGRDTSGWQRGNDEWAGGYLMGVAAWPLGHGRRRSWGGERGRVPGRGRGGCGGRLTKLMGVSCLPVRESEGSSTGRQIL